LKSTLLHKSNTRKMKSHSLEEKPLEDDIVADKRFA
jgi:hypothetical protein